MPLAPVSAAPLATPPGVRVAAENPPPPMPRAPQPVPQPPPNYVPPPLPQQVTTVAVPAHQDLHPGRRLRRADNAIKLQAQLANIGTVSVTNARVNGADLFRVRIGPLASVEEADHVLDRVVNSGVPEARIVVD